MKESAFQSKVLRYLHSDIGGHWIKIHVSSFQSEGEPDIVGCHDGRFYAFELKVGKNATSQMQEYKLQSIRNNGGIALVIRSLEELENVFAHAGHD